MGRYWLLQYRIHHIRVDDAVDRSNAKQLPSAHSMMDETRSARCLVEVA
jgi:hypothetical protein